MEYFTRQLETYEQIYEQNDQEISGALTNLGLAYGDLGNAEKARELLERALAMDERKYGPDHCKVAMNLANVG